MDELKKMTLIYSGELFLFVLVAAALGVLFLTNVISVKDWKKWAFTIVTMLGGVWLVTDFVWTLVSKKRRAKSCLLDKILVVPSGLTLFVLDIYALCHLIPNPSWTGNGVEFFKLEIGIALCYLSLVYLVQGIYHLFVPHPSIIEAIEEEKAELERQKLEALEKAKKGENFMKIKMLKNGITLVTPTITLTST